MSTNTQSTVPQTTADPVLLQKNISQAMALWQQFAIKQFCQSASDLSDPKQNFEQFNESLTNSLEDPSGFNTALMKWGQNVLTNPQALYDANIKLIQQQAELWQQCTLRLFNGNDDTPLASQSDKRFRDATWQETPGIELLTNSYLNVANYWKSLIEINNNLSSQDARKVEFFMGNFIDALSPNNFAHTNPQVWKAIIDSNGENLVQGMQNLANDFQDGELQIRMTDMEAFELGKDIATTPGKVVFRNDLIELIQYEATTAKVRKTPLVIVPPWINKYYILDLREKNSLVKWAVEQGHTVFMISWRNPTSEQADLSFDDYLQSGTLAAIDAALTATNTKEVNLAAYCLGGTLTSATLAYMEAHNDKRVKSATFFTTLIDFSEPGEIGVFIDEGQVSQLEKRMEEDGYLDGKAMGSSFNLLRANDLIWSFFVNLYLLGKEPMPFDLLYWNSDSTRMPAAMHSFYLRNMYMENRFREPGGISLLDTPIDISSIKTPAYFISAHDDHIAPWKTTYKGATLFSGPVRFVLGKSGHIAGIVNPASVDKYGHWTNDKLADTAEEWFAGATPVDRSWWHDWDNWLNDFTDGEIKARSIGKGKLKALCDAPGTYVSE